MKKRKKIFSFEQNDITAPQKKDKKTTLLLSTAYCTPPPASGAPPPTFHGDKVIAGLPLGVAARIGSTPASRVTAVTVWLPGSACDATTITASPTFKSARVPEGSLDNICDRSPPADLPPAPGPPAPGPPGPPIPPGPRDPAPPAALALGAAVCPPLLAVPAPLPEPAPAPPPPGPPAAAPPFALAANLAATSGGNLRRSEFAVTITVTVFFVARSFRVSVPPAAFTVAIVPARFLNDPLTTSSA